MPNKDLNLSLDRSVMPTPAPSDRAPARGNVTASPQHPPTQTATAPPQSGSKAPLLAVAFFAILNMAFISLAGFWLWQQGNQAAARDTSFASNIVLPYGQQINETNEQLASLQQQFNDLQLRIGEQQQLIVSVAGDVNEQLRAVLAVRQASDEPADMAAEPLAQKEWYVNLGTFSHEQAALKLQQQVESKGFQPNISSDSVDGEVAYRVRLAGFADQAAAESAVRQIMAVTDLSGLWVWRDE